MDIGLITVISSIISSGLTAIVTYKVATVNADKDRAVKREEFMDSQMQLLMKTYQTEVDGLKKDITNLQNENQNLRNEVLNLKTKIIELEGTHSFEGKITSIDRG